MSKDRSTFGDQIASKVGEEFKKLATKQDDMRKKHVSFSQRLATDRDRNISDKDKAKQKYDEACDIVETSRQRQEKAEDKDRGLDKAKERYAQDIIDMNNSKNTYLIAIKVANRQKEKYYVQDLPTLMDHMQELNELRTIRAQSIWQTSVKLESDLLKQSQKRLDEVVSSLNKINTKFDSAIFIRYNRNVWTMPPDYEFEPSPIWMDTPDMVNDEPAKIFLNNKLAKSKKRLIEIQPTIQAKAREISGLKTLREAYSENNALGNPDEVTDGMLESIRHNVLLETVAATLQTEVEMVVATVGDTETDQVQHDFKTASFTIPTTCDYCQSTIWGLAKQGFTCKECGFNCHAKCEMKVPADCKKGGGKMRRVTTTSASSLISTPAPNTAASIDTTAIAIYAYEARDDNELTIAEGDVVSILEADDGSGWVRASISGSDGLIPAAYIRIRSNRRVRAMYDYEAQEEGELSIKEGDHLTIEEDAGDGWLTAKIASGDTGLIPANYVADVA